MKSKGRVGVFTQRSGQPGKQGILLCMQMIGISQVLLNWPVQLGWWSWEHLVCSASCVRRMYQPKCSLKNVFFSPHTPSKQPANGLAFQEKKKLKCFSFLANQFRRSSFSRVGVCIMTCSGQIPAPTPVSAWELRWVK